MNNNNNNNNNFSILLLIMSIFIFNIIYVLYNYTQKSPTHIHNINDDYFILNNELQSKIDTLNNQFNQFNQFNQNNQNNQTINQTINETVKINETINERDRSVLNDPLYPLYSRTDKQLMNNINIRTRDGIEDSPRIIAYAKQEDNDKLYYLVGKQSYSRSNLGEFYLIDRDKNSNLKIDLVDGSGRQIIKNYWDIPENIEIKDGIFRGRRFIIQEIKKPNLYSSQI